ncbi:hypothetical protein Undi14_06240 [Undibacterium sp. 14-3-2]|uniref:hypothetical protein n=1 Tax=Undibacterium sp. 14-3-2 TaxID=2800129 RepID=UPI001907CA69|nr:hypothetical protein [Undibacterium sp. 14-3-2]MBK1889628.1 hypothetical protein [Undibacterium sp. 14-3-2]
MITSPDVGGVGGSLAQIGVAYGIAEMIASENSAGVFMMRPSQLGGFYGLSAAKKR